MAGARPLLILGATEMMNHRADSTGWESGGTWGGFRAEQAAAQGAGELGAGSGLLG